MDCWILRSTTSIAIYCVVVHCSLYSQGDTVAHSIPPGTDIYHVNYQISVPGLLLGGAIGLIGQERIRTKEDINPTELSALDPLGVPGIDRIALRQNIERRDRAREISDVGISYATLLPALLFIDERMRSDWLDIAIVYAEAQVAAMNVYSWSMLGPTVIERFRPVAYYKELPLDERTWGGNRNSFYSGHCSTVATWSFFMAKSYLDYHPETQNKWILYAAAALPPAYVGIKRVQGLKHFPSDNIVGCVVGAASGILWPELHKRSEKRMRVSVLYEPEMKLVSLTYQF